MPIFATWSALSAILIVFGFAACGDSSAPLDAGRDAASSDSAMDAAGDAGAGDSGRDAAAADSSALDAAADDSATGDATTEDAGGGALVLPPANGSLDYQLGEPYAPPAGVVVVSRDRNATPATGVYNICYVNGFQTQPDERAFWTSEHPDLLLRDAGGDLVIDPDWDEIILDVRTIEKRAALAVIVGGWIDGCADDGFDAIEVDNLDTYSRSGGLVSQDDAVAFMGLLAGRAHARSLPIAQKNSTEVLSRAAEMGTDFAVAEECNRWNECADYQSVYGNQVYVIEYRRGDFDAGCRDFPGLSVVLRDLPLRAPGSTGYVYDGC
ncbi:MAG: hypothetical protein DRJ42_04990 [Deltaproteobacteria bacterium]|nr:MAG: hypothetical protein DRJ42_04990 [Deltaproteobacteria bacterium]